MQYCIIIKTQLQKMQKKVVHYCNRKGSKDNKYIYRFNTNDLTKMYVQSQHIKNVQPMNGNNVKLHFPKKAIIAIYFKTKI